MANIAITIQKTSDAIFKVIIVSLGLTALLSMTLLGPLSLGALYGFFPGLMALLVGIPVIWVNLILLAFKKNKPKELLPAMLTILACTFVIVGICFAIVYIGLIAIFLIMGLCKLIKNASRQILSMVSEPSSEEPLDQK